MMNFQSFGPNALEIAFDDLTFLLGPNGSGKTAVLHALSRLFCVNSQLRGIRSSDFHVNADGAPSESLFIEATFEFPETLEEHSDASAVPDHFAHMQLETPDGVPQVRFRLEAEIAPDEAVDEKLLYVLGADDNGTPVRTATVSRLDRARVHVHYMPARRDPSDHISYSAASLLGRLLRAADWKTEREQIKSIANQINTTILGTNSSVEGIGTRLTSAWTELHRGVYFASPTISFEGSDLEALLRYMSVGFSPGHGEQSVDFSRLSDGQQSLLYLSLVLSAQALGRDVLRGKLPSFDVSKLRPPSFTLVVMEEPENSLSPQYLGRVIQSLRRFSERQDAQAIVATHSPAMLRRVAPEQIRFLRLSATRTSTVQRIILPSSDDEAQKFVRQAVQSHPEIYFARLVILGEGDSEEIVLARLLQASQLGEDDASISIAPLGGRHVNHFWRLLTGLGIPYVTLLDLDQGRYQGGWGRVRYAVRELAEIDNSFPRDHADKLPTWDSDANRLDTEFGSPVRNWLESKGIYFSSPLDLDFSLLRAFESAYDAELASEAPDASSIKAVLGKAGVNPHLYTMDEQRHFDNYHKIFKLGSKPSAHLKALSRLSDSDLKLNAPMELKRLLALVSAKIEGLPE